MKPRAGMSAPVLALSVALAVAFACASCSESPEPHWKENLAPSVWLAADPPEGSEKVYRVRFAWGGSDPDGKIASYEYAVTDNDDGVFDPADTTRTPAGNPWHRVNNTDSVFVFTADVLVDSLTTDQVSRFERSHTFFIRAVDNRGLASEPAYRSFTAWTLSPAVVISVPLRTGLTPSYMPPISTYHWRAYDFIGDETEPQDPDSVRWILHPVPTNDFPGGAHYIRTHPHSPEWSAWHAYRAEDGSGKAWTTPPTVPGSYMFAVQAKDEAGAVTPVFDEKYNMRRVRVIIRDGGPLLELSSDFTCPIWSAILSPPVVIIDVPGSVPIQWRWRASAEQYGATVAGYRYGWDIDDLDDPAQWEIDFTPFTGKCAASPPRTYYNGVHTFDVEVIDSYGWRSRVEVRINVLPITAGRSLLFVDDFNPASAGIDATNGAVPSDAEHDAFWQQMLSGVSGFSWESDAVQVDRSHPLSLARMLEYNTIVWDAWGGFNTTDAQRPFLYDVVHYRPKEGMVSDCGLGDGTWTNMLSLYMRAGGHIMVCGYQPMTQVLRSSLTQYKYPFIFKYELGGDQDGNYYDQIQSGNAVGDESFGYRDACVNVLDIAYSSATRLRNDDYAGCGVDWIRTVDPKNDGTRTALPIDTAFPALELRPEVAGAGRAYGPDSKGWNSEIYNPPYFEFCPPAELRPPRACFEPIYGNGCLNTASAIYYAPIAAWSDVYADVTPEFPRGVPARSVFLGFEPYYFNPAQVEKMMDVILFDEWMLPRL